MTIWKASELIRKSQCPQQVLLDKVFKRYTQSLQFYAKETFYTMLSVPFDQWTEDWIMNSLEKMIPLDLFSNEKGRWMVMSILKKQFFRFAQYATQQGWQVQAIDKLIDVPLYEMKIPFIEGIIQVHVDVIIESSSGETYLLKTSTKETPFVQTVSKTESKNTNRSMDLYLLELASRQWGREMKRSVKAALVFLKSRKDKAGRIAFEFNVTGNDNWVDSPFYPGSIDDEIMQDRLVEVLQSKNTLPCVGDHCQHCRIENICKYEHVTPLPLVPRQAELKKAGEVKWTDEQLAFIQCESGIYRANAVAGSGKTTVVANRLIQLLLKGYPPESFLLITFTEKGVQEMREKIGYWLVKEGFSMDILNSIRITTFNGFGYQLIQEYYEQLGFQKSPTLIDRIDKIDIIRELVNESPMIENLRYDYPFMRFKNAKGAYLQLAEYFELLKKYEGSGVLSNEYLIELTELSMDIIQLYRTFIQRCHDRNLIDYDDQIALACRLLQDMKIVEELKYRHIIVDEFQDTNVQQLFITQQLSRYKRFCSLVVCGDDSQSIYGFRGADQSIILNFKDIFPQTIDLALTHNFRSTQQIAYVANQLNAINKHRLDKDIVAHKVGEMPQLWRGELLNVAYKIRDYIEQGIPLSEIAVIGRNRKELFEMNEVLTMVGIPSLPVVSELLKDNLQIQKIVAWVRYLRQPEQEKLLCEYLQFAHYEAFSQASDVTEWFNEEKDRFVFTWEALSEEQRLGYVLNQLKTLGKTYRSIRRLVDIVEEKHFSDLTSLLFFIEKIELHDSDLCLEAEEGLDAVVLTTAHASKGREYEVVLLLVSTFKSPHSFKGEEVELAIEEERRLLFVGITRAKNYLELVDIQGKANHGFIQELEAILNEPSLSIAS